MKVAITALKVAAQSFSSLKETGNLCLQAELEGQVAAQAAEISSLKANVGSLGASLEGKLGELQTLQRATESLKETHKATTARLETQLAALNMEKVRNGSLLSHRSVLLRLIVGMGQLLKPTIDQDVHPLAPSSVGPRQVGALMRLHFC